MPLADKPEWKHDGRGNHSLKAGAILLECQWNGDNFNVYVNGALLPCRPEDISEAKHLALTSGRQMAERTRQLLEAVE